MSSPDNAREFSLRFLLNMRILADVFDRFQISISFYPSGDAQTLVGVRIFRRDRTVDPSYVYLVPAAELLPETLKTQEAAFIVIGKADPRWLPEQRPVIVVHEDMEILRAFELMQDTFERYQDWDWKLQQAITGPQPLDDMLLASMEILRNPMFIHDTHFYILSDPRHVPGMSVWEKDARTGRTMVSMELINDFRTDVEYLNGLRERKPTLFSSNQTGYRILFRNLWVGDSYEGRVLIDEILSVLQPGDYYVLDYLGSLIEYSLRHRLLRPFSQERDPETFLMEFLRNGSMDERRALSFLQNRNWNRNDRFVCLHIITEHKDFNVLSANAVLGQIETQVAAGHAFFYNDCIAVVVNLSYNNETSADIVSKLAITMRESLLKVGVSSEIQDFSLLPYAYRQAQIALEFGRVSGSMRWYYYFDEYMLDFIVDCAGREIPLQMLCTEALKKLKAYDEENKTDLCNTLNVYLKFDKNVLRTSKELYIHRSTLAYRLERIQKIIGQDLDDPVERMKLLISFYMEKGYYKS